jgi:membrane protein DedA with SNARE-associated domain
MDFLQSHLQFFAEHPFSVVFFALLIEAAGIPFPTRIILILAPAFVDTDRDLARLAVVAAAGAVLGDHIPYLAGRMAGMRILTLYCRLTLSSSRCVDQALDHFGRYGPPALLLSRFSTSVRILASACAGCGRITYGRYLTLDGLGTLLYTCLWVMVGAVIGDRAVQFFMHDPRRFAFLAFAVLVGAGFFGYRLWRRWREGKAHAAQRRRALDALESRGA